MIVHSLVATSLRRSPLASKPWGAVEARSAQKAAEDERRMLKRSIAGRKRERKYQRGGCFALLML
jgi:hypothetical protein